MAYARGSILSLNAGEAGAAIAARVDLAKMRIALEEQTNFLPRVQGPAVFRPGTQYSAGTLDNQDACCLPFVVNVDTTARIELTENVARFFPDNVLLERPAVTTAVTNGTFDSDLSGWSGDSEVGADSQWVTGGYMGFVGTGSNAAKRSQHVTVVEQGVEHALRVIVTRGPVMFKVGSVSEGDDYIAETSLKKGIHSLGFTPAGDFWITVWSISTTQKLVDSITVESAGPVEIETPWDIEDSRLMRYAQSGDVLFCAKKDIIQKRIERRGQRSWSIVDYAPEDGPFRVQNLNATTITPSALTGNITLTANRATFKTLHVGALWKLTHSTQTKSAELAGEDQSTDYIRVTGVEDARKFYWSVTGTFTATVRIQQAFGEPTGWVDFGNPITGPDSGEITDNFDNQIVYFRMTIKAGEYTSGTAVATLIYGGSLQHGVVRITGYTSPTVVDAEVLSAIGQEGATSNWAEGEWSDYRGYPGSVAFFDGRLWWGWQDRIFGSVSDAYESYDQDLEGDAGPIIRSVATGGFEDLRWILPLQRLIAGTGSQEVSIRSSSFDEPLTPTAFTARVASNRGSGDTQAIGVDSRGVSVQRNGQRIFELAFSVDAQDYVSNDLTRLKPEMCAAGVMGIAFQRQPDTRIWFWLEDGTAAVLTYEPQDEVAAWIPFVTNGEIRDVCVLPGAIEDEVWFVVKREIDGVDTYFHEKLARLDEAEGDTLSKTVDCHAVYSGSATATITGFDHLEGETVVGWGDGVPDPTPRTVQSGAVLLDAPVSSACYGLAYDGKLRGSMLNYGAALGTAVTFPKRISSLGLVMKNVGWKGVRIGRDFTNMTGLSTKYKGRTLAATEVLGSDGDPYVETGAFNGRWDDDARWCLKVSSPYPATVMGVIVGVDTGEKRVGVREQQG